MVGNSDSSPDCRSESIEVTDDVERLFCIHTHNTTLLLIDGRKQCCFRQIIINHSVHQAPMSTDSSPSSTLLKELQLAAKHLHLRKRTDEFVVDQLQKQANMHGSQLLLSLQQIHSITTSLKDYFPDMPPRLPSDLTKKQTLDSLSSSVSKVGQNRTKIHHQFDSVSSSD
jgi:hypothetical protein